MQRKRSALFGVFLALAATLPFGCTKEPAPEPPPFKDLRLRVACPDEAAAGAAADFVRSSAGGWTARQEARVEVVLYDPRQGPPADADAWVIRAGELGRWADAGKL